MQRVTVYIDGFNLYYGLRDKGWQRYYWLDVRRLSASLLRKNQRLEKVRYFTTRVSRDPKNPGKFTRQRTFLRATRTLQDVSIHYGYYLSKRVTCSNCGSTRQTFEEKMTDVNIAVELLGDAQDNVFDTAIIVSADSDLVGPVKAVRSRYTNRRVIVAFPPKRASKELSQVANGYVSIGPDTLRKSQLGTRVISSDGSVLTRPPTWK